MISGKLEPKGVYVEEWSLQWYCDQWRPSLKQVK